MHANISDFPQKVQEFYFGTLLTNVIVVDASKMKIEQITINSCDDTSFLMSLDVKSKHDASQCNCCGGLLYCFKPPPPRAPGATIWI